MTKAELLDLLHGYEHALDVARAQLAIALDRLGEQVRYTKRTGGYMEHDDQQRLRAAEAVLVDNGRSVER